MSAVTLRVYDLSQGMARQLSPAILGKRIDAIWHTSVQVFDREYYFGGGICSDPLGMTPYGTPHSIENMGRTQKTPHQFHQFLSGISPQFSMHSYHLLDNNCNNFTDAVCIFLLDKHIPQHILDLPSEALNSPLGPLIRPMIDQMQAAITQQSIGHQVQLPASSKPVVPTDASPAPDISKTSNSPAPSPANPQPKSYWAVPITLSRANRQAIQRKLHQQNPDIFSVDASPQRDTLMQHALTTPNLHGAFPALDYLRLLALDPAEAQSIAAKITELSNRLILSEQPPPIPCMMALRIFVNLFKHHQVANLLSKDPTAQTLIDSACTSLELDNPLVRKTAAVLLLNISGAHSRYPDTSALTEEHVVRILYAAVARLNADKVPEPQEAIPLMQAVVILADSSFDTKMLLSAFELNINRYNNPDTCTDKDMREAAARIAKLLS